MNVRMIMTFHEEDTPFLLDVSSLLYDFELLHDLSLILCREDYRDYRFSRYFFYRNGRPIKKDHKVRVARIVKESPITVELILTGVSLSSGALWVLLQAIEKIQNWRLNREKLELEVKKLQLEIRKLGLETEKLEVELDKKVKEREAFYVLDSLVGRLDGIPIKLADLHVRLEKNDSSNT